MQFIDFNNYHYPLASAKPTYYSYEDMVAYEYERRLAEIQRQQYLARLRQKQEQQELERRERLRQQLLAEERERQAILERQRQNQLAQQRHNQAVQAYLEQLEHRQQEHRKKVMIERQRQVEAQRELQKQRAQQELQRQAAEQERLQRQEAQRRAVEAAAEQRELQLQQARALEQERLRQQQQQQQQQARFHNGILNLGEFLSMIGVEYDDGSESEDEQETTPAPQHSQRNVESWGSQVSASENFRDPDVSIPADDNSDWDIYNVPCKETAPLPPAEAPLKPLKPEEASSTNSLADFVNSIQEQSVSSKPAGKPIKVNVKRAESGQQEQQQRTETQEPELTADQLKSIEKDLNEAVDTYNRILKFDSSCSECESDEDHSDGVKAITSRIKVLQKAQLKLENVYTQLDKLPKGRADLRKLKRKLVSEAVSSADKVEDLIRTMDSHRTRLVEEINNNRSDSEFESESDREYHSAKKQSVKSSPVRHVTLETVADDSELDFSS